MQRYCHRDKEGERERETEQRCFEKKNKDRDTFEMKSFSSEYCFIMKLLSPSVSPR